MNWRIPALTDDETGLVETGQAPPPAPCAWDEEPELSEDRTVRRDRGWLLPVLVALFAAVVASVATGMAVARYDSQHPKTVQLPPIEEPPVYLPCPFIQDH